MAGVEVLEKKERSVPLPDGGGGGFDLEAEEEEGLKGLAM